MIAEYRNKSNIGVGAGFVLEVAGRIAQSQGVVSQANPTGNPALVIGGGVIVFVGVALFIWGCVQYCLGKGYSGWMGLLGLLSCIGLIVLILLPDKNKGGGPTVGYGGPSGYGGPAQPGTWPPPPQSGLPPAGPPSGQSPYPNADTPPPRKSLSGDDL
jgi:hypothetical protein